MPRTYYSKDKSRYNKCHRLHWLRTGPLALPTSRSEACRRHRENAAGQRLGEVFPSFTGTGHRIEAELKGKAEVALCAMPHGGSE